MGRAEVVLWGWEGGVDERHAATCQSGDAGDREGAVFVSGVGSDIPGAEYSGVSCADGEDELEDR